MGNPATHPAGLRGSAWRLALENLAFLAAFTWLCAQWFGGFGASLWSTARGQGLYAEGLAALAARRYDQLALAAIGLLVTLITLREIALVVVESWRRGRSQARAGGRWSHAFAALSGSFKPTFMSAALGALLPRILLLDIFWLLQRQFQGLALVHVPMAWYGWLYALLAWDLATWIYHYSTHRVRLLWCLHSPHHAPADLTITTAWVHFFAETWFTTTVQLLVLSVLGVPAAMLAVLMGFEVTWGTLIHAGERTFAAGRFGFLRYLVVTPSLHRVHHARNPLYMDTNFCTLLPCIDWLLGTLQPLRDEVRPEYGITRDPDMTDFIDTYFGEFRALWRDVRRAPAWGARIQYLLRPPGWAPDGPQHTASHLRREFLRGHPRLGPAWQPIAPH